MPLVSTNWLKKNLDKVKIIDCSWHMPKTNRNAYKEFEKKHIKDAIFFDLDKNSKKNTSLPHMLTDIKSWEKIVSEMDSRGVSFEEIDEAIEHLLMNGSIVEIDDDCFIII